MTEKDAETTVETITSLIPDLISSSQVVHSREFGEFEAVYPVVMTNPDFSRDPGNAYRGYLEAYREFFPLFHSHLRKLASEASIAPAKRNQPSDESRETKIRELDKLRLENQLLQSQLAEARRATARETRRHDQLLCEFEKLQAQNDAMLNALTRKMTAIDETASLLLQKNNARVRIVESYRGSVEYVHEDSVVVIFEIDDDLVEHKYERRQFVDCQLPNEGDHVTVYVHVVHESIDTDAAPVETDVFDEQEEYQRKKITGPLEFE